MSSISRRAALIVVLAPCLPTLAASEVVDGVLRYRGFNVDMTGAANSPSRRAIEDSIKKQLDIVADCGARPEVMAFFRKQPITVKQQQIAGHDNGGASYTPAGGVTINPVPQPQTHPIVLHELLHAMHTHYLPNGVNNADVERFYGNAVKRQAYPAQEYLMRNKVEFFAVTASVYLWGFVARSPSNRETLREKQPVYYKWLGELFGVAK